ncbi:ATP-binding protein [Gordonia sp. HY285]|uniref:ATP-binding protein n=1 Tax=Gordonia liuliyuniae TaxID=2911517 RepID=UPI001F430C70|nr:ATP-binding protein [Gordonia liuliyuniae]MCF8608894.1 ATP-binding protein [Gordonia liuliyuniae]
MSDLLNRNVEPIVGDFLRHFPAIVIEGARQVGKSTLAARVAQSDALTMNLDYEQVRAAAEADPAGFLAQAGNRQMVIDEIQRMPSLTLAIKAAIDDDRRPGKFILTGSSSLLRVKGLADSLAGRAVRLNLYGLSQGEMAGRSDDFARAVRGHACLASDFSTSVGRDDYASRLGTGAYPEMRTMPQRMRGPWIDGYVQGVVGRDMRELNRLLNPDRVMSMLRVLAGRPSAELVKAKLADETSIPARTVTSYVDLLHDVGFAASIPPWTPNLAKREVGRPKTFVVDSAMAMRLARVTADQLSRLEYGEAFGGFLESFVATELLRQRTWSDRSFDLFHYRDRDGTEVDLILEFDDGSVVGVEVKAAASYNARQFRGLEKLRDELGDRFVAGIVLGTAQTGYRYSPKLYGLPIASLWEFTP